MWENKEHVARCAVAWKRYAFSESYQKVCSSQMRSKSGKRRRGYRTQERLRESPGWRRTVLGRQLSTMFWGQAARSKALGKCGCLGMLEATSGRKVRTCENIFQLQNALQKGKLKLTRIYHRIIKDEACHGERSPLKGAGLPCRYQAESGWQFSGETGFQLNRWIGWLMGNFQASILQCFYKCSGRKRGSEEKKEKKLTVPLRLSLTVCAFSLGNHI